MFKSFMKGLMVAVMILPLAGCQAIYTAVAHRHLEVQTQMSDSIFLPPVAPQDRIVFVQVKNTSSNQDIDLQTPLVQDLQANGWTVTDDMSKAKQILQINILQSGQTTEDNAKGALLDGFGSGLAGGALVGATGGSAGAATRVGIATGLGAVVADAMVQNVTISMITDVQLSVMLPPGQKAQQTTNAQVQQGSQTTVTTTTESDSNWQVYRTRVVSTANRVNLSFESAKPELTKQLASSIAGLF